MSGSAQPATPHRRTGLRVCLAVAGALMAGAALTVIPVWTPGRAVPAGVALVLGALAALTAVILLGTTWRIRPWVGAVLAVAIFCGWFVPTEASMAEDPTQVRIPDLDLTVGCTVSPDGETVTAHAEFRWDRLDLWPSGLGNITAGQGTDSLVVSAPLPEWIQIELEYVPLPNPPTVSGITISNGPWTPPSQPDQLALDGRPSLATWATPWVPTAQSSFFGMNTTPEAAGLAISNSALRPAATYGATWTFRRNWDYAGGIVPANASNWELLPIFMVEYTHLNRFKVQAFGSCSDPERTYPPRGEFWFLY
jgi:hypothetical protein